MFSNSCKYAIRAVLFLAIYTTEEEKAGVKKIASSLEVPYHFLAKILQQLSRQNLISSSKGPTGGFYIDRKNLKTPISKIVECIDGSTIFQTCIMGLPDCSDHNPCPLHEEYTSFKSDLFELFKNKSLGEVADEVKNKGIRF